jgi:hypothetical protein
VQGKARLVSSCAIVHASPHLLHPRTQAKMHQIDYSTRTRWRKKSASPESNPKSRGLGTISSNRSCLVSCVQDDGEIEALQAELKGLNKRSEQLDEQIASVVQSLQRKHSDPAFKERAYVTDEDIKDLDGFSDRSVLSILLPVGRSCLFFFLATSCLAIFWPRCSVFSCRPWIEWIRRRSGPRPGANRSQGESHRPVPWPFCCRSWPPARKLGSSHSPLVPETLNPWTLNLKFSRAGL